MDASAISLTEGETLWVGGDGRCVVAADGEEPGLRFQVPPVGDAACRATQAMLDGAIFAGLSRAGPDPRGGEWDLLRYIFWLVGNYHFASATPPTFRLAADRFRRDGRPDLADFAEVKAREETNHHLLAYRDIAALGLAADRVIEDLRPPSADAFVDFFRSLVQSPEPAGCFGFSYCLERLSLLRDAGFIARIRSLLPGGVQATRFLVVHSAVGNDSEHVTEVIEFIHGLPSADRAAIARAAFQTALLLNRQHDVDRDLTNAELCRRLIAAGAEPALFDAGGFGATCPDPRHE